MYHSFQVLYLFLLFARSWSADDICTGQNQWIADPADCTSFWMCADDRKFKFSCPENTVVSSVKQACVLKGSYYDQCSREQSQLTTTQKPTREFMSFTLCQNQTASVIPHPDNCEKYINCSEVSHYDNGIRECPFPFLWSEEYSRCVSFDKVKCGSKFEPKEPCEYSANVCLNAHCVPCEVRFPNCKGLPNGVNPWKGRMWTTYFVVCREERVAYLSQCSYEKPSTIVFDPEKRMCVMADNRQ